MSKPPSDSAAIERRLTTVLPGVRRLVADNPSPMTGPGTNSYLVGQRRLLLIDPGPADETHIEAVTAAVSDLGATVQGVIPTHFHADHNGGGEALARRLDAPLRRPQAGAEFQFDGGVLSAQHTPGHTDRHYCLWWARRRLLFGGDLVAGQGTILVIPPEGDMADYLASLRAMQALAPAALLPGHGPVIEQPQALLQQYIDHRLAREQQVLGWVARGVTEAAAIAAQIYADRPAALRIGTLQIEAHLEKLRREGRA